MIMDEGEVRKYGSGKNCFHEEKFIRVGKLCEDEKRKRELLEYGRKFLKGVCLKDGVVKKMGRKFVLRGEELDLWYRLSVDVQLDICKYKFENYEEVKEELVEGKIEVICRNMLGEFVDEDYRVGSRE